MLAAGGADVVRFSDLGNPGVIDRLNLILTDNECLENVRRVVGPDTPVARYLFLRDVLINVSTSIAIAEMTVCCSQLTNTVSSHWQ